MPTLGTKRMMDRMSYQSNKRARTMRERRRAPLPETKFKTTSISHLGTTTSNTFVTGVANGPDRNERIGRKIKNLFLEGRFQGGINLRCVLYISKSGTTTLSLTNPYDAVNPDDFIVLKDWWIQPPDSSLTARGVFKHKLPYGLNTEFTGPNESDIVQGQVALYIHTDASTNVQGHVRTWYVDN